MTTYKRGEKVYYLSPVSGEQSRAIFVSYDEEGFPKRDCILAIGIGVSGNRMTHQFRWPLRYLTKLRNGREGRTITRRSK